MEIISLLKLKDKSNVLRVLLHKLIHGNKSERETIEKKRMGFDKPCED